KFHDEKAMRAHVAAAVRHTLLRFHAAPAVSESGAQSPKFQVGSQPPAPAAPAVQTTPSLEPAAGGATKDLPNFLTPPRKPLANWPSPATARTAPASSPSTTSPQPSTSSTAPPRSPPTTAAPPSLPPASATSVALLRVPP